MPSVLSQEETVEMLEEMLKYAKAGHVEAMEIVRTVPRTSMESDVTEVKLRRSVPVTFD